MFKIIDLTKKATTPREMSIKNASEKNQFKEEQESNAQSPNAERTRTNTAGNINISQK